MTIVLPVMDYRTVLQNKLNELTRSGLYRDALRVCNNADEIENIQERIEQQKTVHQINQEAKTCREIRAALTRLDDDQGEFGVCLLCEKPIPEIRLKAIPWAPYCVPCQEECDQIQFEMERELAD